MQRMMIRRRGARCSGSGAVALNQLRASLTAVPFLASLAPCCADPAPIIHYAPGENLEHIDVALIDRADLAHHLLNSRPRFVEDLREELRLVDGVRDRG